MDSPSGCGEKDFSMSLSDLGKRDKEFARCRKLIKSAYGYGGGDPGLAKWIVRQGQAAGHFDVLGRLFDVGFTPSPYYKPKKQDDSDDDDDFEPDHGGDRPVYRKYVHKYEHNEAAEVHFTGKTLDGTVFASSWETNMPLTFKLMQEGVMPGFTLAVASMQPGEKATFTIPPEFAVTMSGCGASIPWNIPSNQTLRFDIELISLITDILDDQGILRKTVKFGRWNEHPRDSDVVYVSYNAFLMDRTPVSKSEGIEFNLEEGLFCPAFAHAVKAMTEGEEAVLIIKPEYGFGDRGRPSIGNEGAVPPDATLSVNLQLMSWKTVSRIGELNDIIKKTPFEANKPNISNYIRNHAVVKVRLVGKLQDGTVFEQRGHDGEEPFELIIDEGHVIDGLEEGVMTMKAGEVASFTIPPEHAFGTVGSYQYQLAAVPPNSTVIYEIEILSVVNEDHSAMTLDEIIESARKKKMEGDHLFSSGMFLRAYRRYFKASQILRSRMRKGSLCNHGMPKRSLCNYVSKDSQILRGKPKPDGEIKQMLISLAFSGAQCAMQLQCFKQASDCIHEVLKYDPENVEALKLVAQPFPEHSVQMNKIIAMHRGSCSWTSPLHEDLDCWAGAFLKMQKRGHKPSGRLFFVPPRASESPAQSQATQATPATGSPGQSSGTASKGKTSLIGSCLGLNSSSG